MEKGQNSSCGALIPRAQRTSQRTERRARKPPHHLRRNGFLQLTIRESDRHLTAFCDAEGKLWEYVRCGFGLKTVPSAFANYVGGQLMPVKMKGVRIWLDDITIPTATMENQFVLLHKVFDLIRAGRLSVNIQKSEFRFPVVE